MSELRFITYRDYWPDTAHTHTHTCENTNITHRLTTSVFYDPHPTLTSAGEMSACMHPVSPRVCHWSPTSKRYVTHYKRAFSISQLRTSCFAHLQVGAVTCTLSLKTHGSFLNAIPVPTLPRRMRPSLSLYHGIYFGG